MGEADKGWLLGMEIYLVIIAGKVLMIFILNYCFLYEKKKTKLIKSVRHWMEKCDLYESINWIP